MNDLLNATLQSFGLRKTAPLGMDVKLLVDGIGRTLPMQFTGGNPYLALGTDGSDLTRNGYSNHATAYAVINYILATGQTLPWGVYKLQADDTGQRLPKHPLYDLLYRPNPTQTWPELLTAAKGYLLTTGNAYLYGVRGEFGSKTGKIGEIWCLPAPLVEVEGGGWLQEVTGYSIRNDKGGKTTYAPEDILHLKYWNPESSKYGLSPVAAGIDSITAAKAGLTSRVRQYQNEGPPGVISGKGNDGEWTTEQANRVQDWFGSFFRGKRREGKIPVTNQEVVWTSMGLSPVDLDVLAAIPHDKDAVADLYRFPGELLNGSKGTTYANANEADKGLWTRCIIPLDTQIRDGLNRWVGPDWDDAAYFDFDISGIHALQTNKAELVTWLDKAWWIPVAEKQRLLGIDVPKGMEWTGPVYLAPGSYVGADTLTALPPADV